MIRIGKSGKHIFQSRITNCYIETNSKGEAAIIINSDGTVDLNLDSYYIIPRDKYAIIPLSKMIRYGSR